MRILTMKTSFLLLIILMISRVKSDEEDNKFMDKIVIELHFSDLEVECVEKDSMKYPLIKLPFGINNNTFHPSDRLSVVADINSEKSYFFEDSLKNITCVEKSKIGKFQKNSDDKNVPDPCIYNISEKIDCNISGFWPNIQNKEQEETQNCFVGKIYGTVFNHSYIYASWWDNQNIPSDFKNMLNMTLLQKKNSFKKMKKVGNLQDEPEPTQISGVIGLSHNSDYAAYVKNMYSLEGRPGFEFMFDTDGKMILMPDPKLGSVCIFKKKVNDHFWSLPESNFTIVKGAFQQKNVKICFSSRTEKMLLIRKNSDDIKSFLRKKICPDYPRGCLFPPQASNLKNAPSLNFSFFSSDDNKSDKISVSIMPRVYIIPGSTQNIDFDLWPITPEQTKLFDESCDLIFGINFLKEFNLVFSQTPEESHIYYYTILNGTEITEKMVVTVFINIILGILLGFCICRITWVYRGSSIRKTKEGKFLTVDVADIENLDKKSRVSSKNGDHYMKKKKKDQSAKSIRSIKSTEKLNRKIKSKRHIEREDSIGMHSGFGFPSSFEEKVKKMGIIHMKQNEEGEDEYGWQRLMRHNSGKQKEKEGN